MRMRILLAVVLAAMAGLLYRGSTESRAQEIRPIPTTGKADEIRQAMHVKLHHSQQVLHGLVTRDFSRIQSAAGALKQVSLAAPKELEGDQTDNELYEHFKLEFLRLTTQLEETAKARNLDGAAFAYQNLTANCLACHSYLAEGK